MVQELASKGRIVEDVIGALRNEEAAKLAAQRDAQTARTRMHQLEVPKPASPQLRPSFTNLLKRVHKCECAVSMQASSRSRLSCNNQGLRTANAYSARC